MKPNCKLLPPLIEFDDYGNDWTTYRDALYSIFKRDFIDEKTFFNNKPVEIRINPKENNYEHGFIHLITVDNGDTSGDPNNRIPEFRRCERLEWNKIIIGNYPCFEDCPNCNKIKYYENYYKSKVRINLLFEDYNYKVILERRENYYLLITGFYIAYSHRMKKELRNVELFEKQKTPLS